MFGLLIGVPVEELEAIKGRGDRIDHCFQSVLLEWLKNGPSPRTKVALLEALRGNTLRENALAEDLKESECEALFPLSWFRINFVCGIVGILCTLIFC